MMNEKEQKELVAAFKAAMFVLEGIRATHPSLIADNMLQDWGMNQLRSVLSNLPEEN